MQKNRMLNLLERRKTVFAAFIAFSALAQASWITGAYGGFGGTGINTTRQINGVDIDVQRSDAPGVYGVYIEHPLSFNSSLAIDHTSGFTLSPFSSGVEFTGMSYRYYWPGEMPSMRKSVTGESTLLVQKFELFVAGSLGIARGVINRQNDAIPEVAASGVYFGGRLGADYQMNPSIVCRSEIVFGSTMPSAGFVKATLSEFGLVSGIYYMW